MKNRNLYARVVARNARPGTNNRKVYALANDVPSHVRGAGLVVLNAIKRLKMATSTQIRLAMPAGFADGTVRYYLGKFQSDGIIIAA